MEKTREILFRGFHECQEEDAEEIFPDSQFTEILINGRKVKGVWLFGNFISNENRPIIAGNPAKVTDEFVSLEWYGIVIPKTCGQFTGDVEFNIDENGNTKNGRKIFEGDIIEIRSEEDGNGIYLVFWDEEKSGWNLKHISGAYPSEDYIDGIQVIGNKWNCPKSLLGKGSL